MAERPKMESVIDPVTGESERELIHSTEADQWRRRAEIAERGLAKLTAELGGKVDRYTRVAEPLWELVDFLNSECDALRGRIKELEDARLAIAKEFDEASMAIKEKLKARATAPMNEYMAMDQAKMSAFRDAAYIVRMWEAYNHPDLDL